MFRRIVALCAACAMVLWAAAVSAGPVSFVFGQAAYSAAAGGKVNVPVYWQETVGEGETSVLDLALAVGMFGQGVQVRWDDPVMPSHPATVVSTADIAYNPVFDDAGSMHRSVTASYAQLSEVTDFLSFGYGNEVSPGAWRQLIGTFSFTAGSVPGEVTHLGATRYVGPLGTEDYIIDANGTAYDGVTAIATATITVTPEPSGLMLLGMAALTCFAWRCWGRRFSGLWGIYRGGTNIDELSVVVIHPSLTGAR
jgi:hypothetical protein